MIILLLLLRLLSTTHHHIVLLHRVVVVIVHHTRLLLLHHHSGLLLLDLVAAAHHVTTTDPAADHPAFPRHPLEVRTPEQIVSRDHGRRWCCLHTCFRKLTIAHRPIHKISTKDQRSYGNELKEEREL